MPMRGINESSYLTEEHGAFDSDVDGSVSGVGGSGAPMGNVYTVEHLATFGLSEDLAFPADGMRRLLHMEKAGFGIWSQKMRIRLEYRYIVILDYENGNEMERFPMQLIRDPTAFTNPNPGELYNNIVAFVVHPHEMHIFQCFNISATDLVEDVKMALSGRLPPQRQRHGSQNSLPPPPLMVPAVNDEVRDEDVSSVGSEGNYDREVAILNRCFDDIERFIARLQYAAAAFRELQRRRKSKKNKKKDHGEGLLSMRAKPPHEREFVDILQKFKLSFNLLARLKIHIHDPNAPELVHFLFTPLALIVDASRDAHRAGLASQVASPLLSPGAIELLNNCLSSKETELWHSLGDAWLLSREQWKGYVAPYQPVFMDGWSPTIQESSLGGSVASDAQIRLREMQAAKARQQQQIEAAHQLDTHTRESRSISPVDMMGDEFSSGQRAFVDSVRSRGGRVVVVTHPRTANNHKELTVVRGEHLEVLDDTKKWWKARNWKGTVAHVPHTIVSSPNDFPHPQEPGPYHGMDNHHNGRGGQWSPPSSSMSSDDDAFTFTGPMVTDSAPKPEPSRQSTPEQPPSRPKFEPAKAQPVKEGRPLSEMHVQEELSKVLDIFREKRSLQIQKTPEVYIDQDSSVSEVHDWLKAKGFSDKVVRQLTGMNGGELFALKPAQIEEFVGKEEGRRLVSQITVSRNFSGLKTARSSELRAILAKARARTDGEEVKEAPSKDKSERKKATETNTRLNSVRLSESHDDDIVDTPEPKSKPKSVSNSQPTKPVKSSGSSYSTGIPPPPPPIMRTADSSNSRNKSSASKTSPSKSASGGDNFYFKSNYAPPSESEDDNGSDIGDAEMDGTSTLSRMIKQKQRQMVQRQQSNR